ncbi:hypothetical protein ABT024_05395 [Streptomyces sp. NPDC002812]|uniref:hypothetical protein n=1 Tax=Streptomyces sp. NPDC002812 TaxID=3154434 RepID=UPI00332CE731
MAEGIQAGRLEVTVVAALDGFAEKLRAKVEEAAEGLAVKVKVEVDSKGLRKRLKRAVQEASEGVTAKVRVRVDRAGIRTELEDVARQAAESDVRIPVRADEEGRAGGGGGLLGRIRSLLRGAQVEADQNPVSVPVQLRMPRRRGALRMLGMGALLTVIQPAVGALTLYGGALTALVGAAAPAVGVLGALPGLIAAAGTAAIATKVAFGGFGEALKQTLKAQAQLASGAKLTKAQQQALDESLKGLSESARKTVKNVAGLSGEWRIMRQSVQERFFSKIADEIKPLSDAVLPLLKDSLGDAAGQMGELAQRGAKAMQSGPFAKDFKAVAGTNSKVIGNITDGVGNLAAAAGHFLVASGPFVERIGEAGERFTRWIRSSAQAGRETGSLARFLDHAATKAKQLGRTTLYLSKGLAGVGRAGMDAGDALLNGLEGTMLRFSRWANSGAGNKAMQQFFSDAAPVFHELNLLVGDLGRGLGKMAKDNGLADLIAQIRTELMPGIGRFLDSLGRTVGPAVIGIISNLATAIASLSAAGTGLGVLLASFNGLLNIFNGLLRVVPGLGVALGILLGALLLFKVVRGITTAMTGMATAVRNLGSTARTSTNAVGPHITAWQRMNGAYTSAAAGAGRMSGAMAAVRSGMGSMRLGMGGLLGALGGPWGAAIAAVTIGIGLLANSHEKASRAAAAQQQRISSLAQALRDSNGAIDANVRAQAAQLLQDTKMADGKSLLVDRMRAAGVSLKELTDAYLGPTDAISKMRTELEATAKVSMGMKGGVLGYNETGLAAARAADALKEVNGDLQKGKQKYSEWADAQKAAGSTGTDAFSRLKVAVDGMSNSTASADERVNSLKRALDALTGGTESFHDAQTRVNSAILSVKDAMEENTEKLKDASGELINYDGSVNTASKSGQSFNSHLKELRDSAASAAVAAYDLAKTNGTPLSEALAKGQGEMTKARDAAVAYGMDLGLTKEQAEGLANSLGLMPSTVSILLNAKGIPEANAQILNLHTQLATLPAGKTIQVTAPGDDAITALRGVGYEVTLLPGGKMVSISAPTDAARGQLQQFIDKLAAAPADKNVTINALISEFAAELETAKQKIASVPLDKDTTLNALTGEARKALEDLGYKIRDVPGSKEVTVSAPTGNAIGALNSLQSRVNQLHGKDITITVSYDGVNSDGSPHIAGMGRWANGGILKFAEGGFHNASRRIKAFANGTEKHVAQIARAGEMRLWAEPETAPGEAYIPLAPKKRKRSAAILDTVAQFFGGMVVYPGQMPSGGGLSPFANGAVSLHQSSRVTATTRSAAVPPGNSALVGGDLNLTMTGAPMTPGEAIGNAMFELRRIRRGGAHAS